MEELSEAVKQGQKTAPDLLELIMKPSGLVREELRPVLFRMDRYTPQITKINQQIALNKR